MKKRGDLQFDDVYFILFVQHTCLLFAAIPCIFLGFWLWEDQVVSLSAAELAVYCIDASLLISYILCMIVTGIFRKKKPVRDIDDSCFRERALTLKRYKELLDMGAITEKEYEQIKRDLLQE